MYQCKKCNSSNLVMRKNSKKPDATELICADCGTWQKFLGKNEIRILEAETPKSETTNDLKECFEKPSRISKRDYYIEIAKVVSKRSTCLRRQYGCVIVKNDEIIATGYNGAPRGTENCCDTGKCYREMMNIPHGEQYEKCVAVHAEQNALISASRQELIGSSVYLAGFENGKEIIAVPCLICDRMLKNAGVKEIINSCQMKNY